MQKLENIKSVLIIRSGALGDTVYATAVLDALRSEFGDDIKIDWIGTPAAVSLFKYDNRVQKVFTLKHRRLPAIINLEKRRIISYSKKHPYDLLINLESGPHFNDLTKALKANIKHGNPFTEPMPDPEAIHMVEHMKRFYKALISDENYKKAFPKLFGEPFNIVKQKFSLPAEYFVIAPSNSHTNRNKINYRAWPSSQWKELISKLGVEENIVLIGNRGEEDYFQKLQPYPKNVIALNGKSNLTELIAIIQNAKALITTDTGPAHIASATSTPVHCLIGPTNPASTGPYKTPKNEVYIISKELDCSPCYYLPHIKTCTDNICMKQISVEDVFNSLKAAK